MNNDFMEVIEVHRTAQRGNEICSQLLKPLEKEDDFRFPLATVNVANSQGFGAAVKFAMHHCKTPERHTMRDAEEWVSLLIKKAREK